MSLKNWQIRLLIALSIIALVIGIGLTNLVTAFNNLEDVSQLDAYSQLSVPTKIYDIKGRLITEYYLEKRDIITFNELPQDLIRAIIATEDNRFYEHGGANFIAMVQGVLIDPLFGRRMRGGSGLTQQLAKLLFTDSSRSVQRKIVELWYAFQIEKKYTKEEILELYFNLIYFGHGQYGVESASQFYFDKSSKDLSLGEASFLAGLPQAPSRYSPILNYKEAQERHYVVLKSLAKNGYISNKTAEETFSDFWVNYDNTFVAATRNISGNNISLAPFFTEYIRQKLLERYGEDLLYKGGLEIHTTLNLDYQIAANQVMQNRLTEEQNLFSSHYNRNATSLKNSYEDILDLLSVSLGIDSFTFTENRVKKDVRKIIEQDQDIMSLTTYMLGMSSANREIDKLYKVENLVTQKVNSVEGALISIDPNTGYIQAMVGGHNYSVANQFNRSTQAQRQMGSTFKAFIYALALENKLITSADIFKDEVLSYRMPNGSVWTPRNYSGTYYGPMTVRRALKLSVNTITIQIWEKLLKQIHYDRVIRQLGSFFGVEPSVMQKRVPNELAASLGTGTASPIEMAQAFSVFVNGGHAVEPIAILKVFDRNRNLLDDFKTIHQAKPKVSVISPETAKIMQSLLHDVIRSGTGAGAARRANYNPRYTSGKSGTSNNWTDAWFAGFTEKSTTVVWIGLDNFGRSLGKGRSSSLVAAPAWMNYMKQISDIDAPKPLPVQLSTQGLNSAFVSSYTGLLTRADDPNGYIEYFLPGTAPQTYGDPEAFAKREAERQVERNYEVTGEGINLTEIQTNDSEEDNSLTPYIIPQQQNTEDLDLSFDLSSGL